MIDDNSTDIVKLPSIVADTDRAIVYIIIVFLLEMDILPHSVENGDLEWL